MGHDVALHRPTRGFPRYTGGIGLRRPQPRSRMTVHSRPRGEHRRLDRTSMGLSDSSPRLRGTGHSRHVAGVLDRFIPAPARNTRITRPGLGSPAVHPRACGKHLVVGAVGPAALGSSPRLRGTQGQHGHSGPWTRFIPAPAGNTAPTRRAACG